jgi:hypothetical protein
VLLEWHPHKLAGRALRASLAVALCGIATAALTGCDDGAPPHGTHGDAVVRHADPHRVAWLDVSNPISPGQWLASRDEAKLKPPHDPEVQRLVGLLATAHSRYRESERMIANRSAQLSDMLKPIGIDESAIDILNDLTAIGGEIGQTEGFGAISQYYFNLRAASVSRAEALATLKTRYGQKS